MVNMDSNVQYHEYSNYKATSLTLSKKLRTLSHFYMFPTPVAFLLLHKSSDWYRGGGALPSSLPYIQHFSIFFLFYQPTIMN